MFRRKLSTTLIHSIGGHPSYIQSQVETDRMELDAVTVPAFERVLDELDKFERQCREARTKVSSQKKV